MSNSTLMAAIVIDVDILCLITGSTINILMFNRLIKPESSYCFHNHNHIKSGCDRKLDPYSNQNHTKKDRRI